MPPIIITTLSPLQKSQIQSMNSTFPVDEADLFVLFEIDGTIRSAAAFFSEGDDTYECYAFTDPAYRHQGLFSELLEIAIETLPEDAEFLFYTNGTDPDTQAALLALEAELVFEEHMMEIDLASSLTKAEKLSENPVTITSAAIEGTLTRRYSNPYGSVNISVFSSHYYLYGLEIKEEYRGKGYGNQLFNQVLLDLASLDPLPLRLQVSENNIPAVSLYKKTGFQITETLFGYLY